MNVISQKVHPEPNSGHGKPRRKVCFEDINEEASEESSSGTVVLKLHCKAVDLKHELRLLYKWMACSGIGCPVRMTQKKYLLILQRLYSTTVLLLLWLNFLRTLSAIKYSDFKNEVLVAQIVTVSWFLQCALKATIWFFRDMQPSSTEDFFKHWNKLCQSQTSLHYGLGINQPKLRRSIQAIIAAIILLSIVNTTIIFLARIGPIEDTKNETLYYYAPLPQNTQIPIMSLIPFETAAYFFPVAEFVVIAKVLTRQFINLKTVVIDCLKKNGFVESIESIRIEHQNLAMSVYKADQTFCFYLAIEYSTTIAMLTFLMYQLILIHNQFSLFVYGMMIIWLTAVFFIIASISWFAAVMHEQAHELVYFIHDAVVPPNPSNKEILEMNMFLGKLNGPSIAFTVYTMLPITKGFILTVVGVILTYFAVAEQSLNKSSL